MITSKLTLKGRDPYPLPEGIDRRMSYSHLNVYSRSFALGLQVKKVNLK